jgi:hypothetical protein
MKRIDKISLIIAGLITFLNGTMHFTFFPVFNSIEIKNCLKEYWPLLHPLTFSSIILCYLVAYISIIHSKELLSTKIGRPLLICFSLLYVIRLISEFAFMDFNGILSLMWIIICLVPIVIYSRILMKNLKGTL